MVTKQGTWRAKIPTQFRTKKFKKKVLKQEGNKFNYEITKCVICSKRKMERYDLKDPKGELFRINKCKNCNFQNASVVTAYNNAEEDNDDPYVVTYFRPKALEDKS